MIGWTGTCLELIFQLYGLLFFVLAVVVTVLTNISRWSPRTCKRKTNVYINSFVKYKE